MKMQAILDVVLYFIPKTYLAGYRECCQDMLLFESKGFFKDKECNTG